MLLIIVGIALIFIGAYWSFVGISNADTPVIGWIFVALGVALVGFGWWFG